jgi:hypothetical protein
VSCFAVCLSIRHLLLFGLKGPMPEAVVRLGE